MGLKGSFSSLLQTLFCGLSVLLNLWLDFGACMVLQHLGFEGSLSYRSDAHSSKIFARVLHIHVIHVSSPLPDRRLGD